MAMTLDSEREAFEASFAGGPDAQLTRKGVGYLFTATDLRWQGWQVRAHLTQPAQAVDVGAIREVIAFMESRSLHGAAWEYPALDKLTRALAGEQADAVARGQSLGMVVYHDDESAAAKLEGRRVLIMLDHSPTPDKDQR